ncbi:MAG: isoleucine--tRNA ligase, partial [Burkholderiaceae bacterium]|nr:isoleucine--tRNA ligase [Burkholderiaceae bacterium]
IREAVNKAIEDVRSAGGVGSSLQAEVVLGVNPQDLSLLQSLGEDLKFVLITSAASLVAADELSVTVTPSTQQKCERCWHYRDDVGSNPEHPTICGRCDSNLHGAGETRLVA